MIKQETIDKILESASIVDVISEFVSLKRNGVNHKGCCPFHAEKTASFIVSPVKNIYKCFGCGAGGNVVKFIQEHEKISYPEAITWLANKYHIEIERVELTPDEKIRSDKRESIKVANEWAATLFTADLEKPEAIAYINERKVAPDVVAKFRLGFAIDSWNNLLSSARMRQFNEQILIDASLVGKTGDRAFDKFRNRIMFPFLDLSGNVIGFTGRLLVKKDDEAKYLNSSDTEVFKKGNVLFGLYQAKKAIITEDKAYLVEGNFDVTSFHQAKIENTVCGSGTALTKEQIHLLQRFTNNITVVYDGDAAGIKASFKNIDLMLSMGVNVRAIALPMGEDPDSLAKKMKPKDLVKLLEDSEKDFISFKYEILAEEIEKDPLRQSELINEFLNSIALIPEKIVQDIYRRQCVQKFKIDQAVVDGAFKRKPRKKEEGVKIEGWLCLDFAKDSIIENDEVMITGDIERMYKEMQDTENVIGFAGDIAYNHLQELNAITHNIILLDKLGRVYDKDDQVTPLMSLCKKLFIFGFNLKVEKQVSKFMMREADDEEEEIQAGTELKYVSFIEAYMDYVGEYIDQNEFDNEKKNMAIEQAAELLSHADSTTIHVGSKAYARKMGIKDTDLKKIMKPYLEKNRTKSALQNEVVDEGEMLHLDPDRLPDYVDKTFFSKWGYFPYQNKKGEKVRYVFRTQEGGLQVIGNFFIEPLFHVYSNDVNRNKRIIRVNNAEQGRSYFMEMASSTMIEFAMFKKALFNEGANVFTKGKSNHHEVILASIANQFPICYELEIFGQQPEGFWAFANAIYAEGRITFTDELGLVTYKDRTYYSPAFSKIYAGQRKDDDKFENQRNFVYAESRNTTFEEWARLMDQVYTLNNNGKWSMLFAIMATFRSDIYPIDRLFTSLFFTGPTDSGKSQVAISIRSLFMKYDTPLFNLNSGSDAAFFTTLERYRDVPIIYEEYNDNDISDTKFQGLKAAVYDGEGKQKRKDATSKELDISKVNAVPILLGQEAPERDDGSLGNRCIICHVPKKLDWTEEETNLFHNLKKREKAGISNILLEILRQRELVQKHFQPIQRAMLKRLKEELTASASTFQPRLLNTGSLFAAMCKLWEDYVPSLRLPFTFEEFFTICKAKIVAQSEAILNTNRLSVFFDTLELLLNRSHNGLTPGKEFKIELRKSVTVLKNRTETEEKDFDGIDIKVIYLRLNILHPMYVDVRKQEALKLNNLMNYLKDHPGYIGTVKSTKFDWVEIAENYDPLDNKVTKIGKPASANTSAIAMQYDKLGIDLEKFVETGMSVTYGQPKQNDGLQQEINYPKPPVEDGLPF